MTRIGKLHPPDSARLFSESEASTNPPPGICTANIDGASRGNPGPASYAVVIRDSTGNVMLELAKKLGRETNNVAEYYALLAALDYAVTHGVSALRIRSDSELLVRQMQGRYKVKSPELKPLFERASKMVRQIPYFKIEHVRREMNSDADALANLALDSGDFSSVAQKIEGPRRPAELRSATSPLPATKHLPGLSKESQHKSESRRVLAQYVRGVFVPAERVDLPEGSEVIIDFRPAKDE